MVDWDPKNWTDAYLPRLKIYSRILANKWISPEDVISIAFYRVIRYGKTTPETLWVPLCKHVGAETNIRRRRKKRDNDLLGEVHEEAVHEDDVETTVLFEECLSHVSKMERFLLIKHFCEGSTFEELGFALGVSWGTVRNRITAAIEKIRAAIGEDK